jgi:branched-chain amino acid transport system ATP-binding protein
VSPAIVTTAIASLPAGQVATRAAVTQPLLDVHDLTVRFGDFVALRGVSLRLGGCDVHAVIGPNGAGKTTLFNAISGFAQPSAGRVWLDRTDITGLRADRLARRGLARSFQICAVFPALSVEDNVRVALLRDVGGVSLLRRAAGTALEPFAEELLASCGLASERARRVADLSYGRRRLLEIVTTLAVRPKLLLLDEPTAGLAREDIPMVTRLIAQAARTCSVLLVEHNLQVVENLAAQVTVLAEGSVLCAGTYRDVARDPRVLAAYIGGDPDA